MSEWKKFKLEDICLKITDGSHFSPKGIKSGHPMFSVKDMGEYNFSLDNCKFISDFDFEEMIRNDCIPQINDILIAKDGSMMEHIFQIKNKCEGAILSSIAMLRPNCNVVFPAYLCYYS